MTANAGSFIKSEILKDIRGRSRFVCTPLDEHLKKHADPGAPATPSLYSELDELCLKAYGVDHSEVRILLEEAQVQSFTNATIRRKLKELLTLTKLQSDEAVTTKLSAHRHSIEARRQDILRRDSAYQSKLRTAAAKRDHIRKSWETVAAQVRTRWKSILKSLSVALSRHELFVELHERDQYVITYLADRCPDACAIEQGRVTLFDVDKLLYLDFKDLQDIVNSVLVGEELDMNPLHIDAIKKLTFTVS